MLDLKRPVRLQGYPQSEVELLGWDMGGYFSVAGRYRKSPGHHWRVQQWTKDGAPRDQDVQYTEHVLVNKWAPSGLDIVYYVSWQRKAIVTVPYGIVAGTQLDKNGDIFETKELAQAAFDAHIALMKRLPHSEGDVA